MTGTARHRVLAGMANGRGSGEGAACGTDPVLWEGKVLRGPCGSWQRGGRGLGRGGKGQGLGSCRSSDAGVGRTQLPEVLVDTRSPASPRPLTQACFELSVTLISAISTPAPTFPIKALWSPGTTGLWGSLLGAAWGLLAGNGGRWASHAPGSHSSTRTAHRVSAAAASLGRISFLHPRQHWGLYAYSGGTRMCKSWEHVGSRWA